MLSGLAGLGMGYAVTSKEKIVCKNHTLNKTPKLSSTSASYNNYKMRQKRNIKLYHTLML